MNARKTKQPWYVPNKWNVSHLAFHDEVRGKMNLPERVYVRDLTLREGSAQAGIHLRTEEKVEYSQSLAEIGVAELEVGYPTVIKEDHETLLALTKAKVPITKSAMPVIHMEWDSRDATEKALRNEVDVAIDAGADRVKISMVPGSERSFKPGSLGSLNCRMKMEEVLPRARIMFDQAKSRGIPYDIGPFDVLRASLDFTRKSFSEFSKAGIDRIYISDEGVGTPSIFHFFVEQVRKFVGDIPIGVHIHNDFGLATANTLAAVEMGVEVVDTIVNGYGHHGIAPLEEVVSALEILYGVNTGVKMENLCTLSKTLEKITGIEIQLNKPIVGAFTYGEKHEGRVRSLLETNYTWSPDDIALGAINPEVVGNSYKIFWERVSLEPDNALRLKLKLMSLKFNEETLDKLKKRLLWEASTSRRGYLTNEEFESICRASLRGKNKI
jgi:isopropylmalate/homocitrate/citramalate synthase